MKIKCEYFKPTQHSRLCLVHFEKACYDRDPENMAARCYPGAKLTLKVYDVPTLISVVEAMLMLKTILWTSLLGINY